MNTEPPNSRSGDKLCRSTAYEATDRTSNRYIRPGGRLLIREMPLGDENWSEIIMDDENKE